MASPSHNHGPGTYFYHHDYYISCLLYDLKKPCAMIGMKKAIVLLVCTLSICTLDSYGQKDGKPSRTWRQSQNDFAVYGNPASNTITLSFNSKETTRAILVISYSDGKLLAQKELAVNKGKNTWKFTFPSASTGLFLIKLKTPKSERTTKVVKSHHGVSV